MMQLIACSSRTFRFAVTAVVLMSTWLQPTATGAQQPVRPEWKFEVGQEFEVLLQQTTSVESTIENRQKKFGSDMLLVFDWKIESAGDDGFSIVQSIRRCKLELKSPTESGTQTTKLDTDGSSDSGGLAEDMLQQILPLIGATFVVQMDRSGRILSVEVPDETRAAIRQAPASMQLRRVLSADGITDLFGQAAIEFPAKPIAPGHRWETNRAIAGPFGEIERKTAYTFSGLADSDQQRGYEIDVEATLAADQKADTDSQLLNFEGTGSIWFGPESDSLLLKSKMESELAASRQHRDKEIRTAVETNVVVTIARASE